MASCLSTLLLNVAFMAWRRNHCNANIRIKGTKKRMKDQLFLIFNYIWMAHAVVFVNDIVTLS